MSKEIATLFTEAKQVCSVQNERRGTKWIPPFTARGSPLVVAGLVIPTWGIHRRSQCCLVHVYEKLDNGVIV